MDDVEAAVTAVARAGGEVEHGTFAIYQGGVDHGLWQRRQTWQ